MNRIIYSNETRMNEKITATCHTTCIALYLHMFVLYSEQVERQILYVVQ